MQDYMEYNIHVQKIKIKNEKINVLLVVHILRELPPNYLCKEERKISMTKQLAENLRRTC